MRQVINVVNCPRCNEEAQPTGKEWKYNLFHVKSYSCKECQKNFQAYFMHGAFSHTIPKSKQ